MWLGTGAQGAPGAAGVLRRGASLHVLRGGAGGDAAPSASPYTDSLPGPDCDVSHIYLLPLQPVEGEQAFAGHVLRHATLTLPCRSEPGEGGATPAPPVGPPPGVSAHKRRKSGWRSLSDEGALGGGATPPTTSPTLILDAATQAMQVHCTTSTLAGPSAVHLPLLSTGKYTYKHEAPDRQGVDDVLLDPGAASTVRLVLRVSPPPAPGPQPPQLAGGFWPVDVALTLGRAGASMCAAARGAAAGPGA